MKQWLYQSHTEDKYNSRRYKLILLLTFIVTLLFVVPPTMAFVWSIMNPSLPPMIFTVLTEASYVTLMFGVWGGYLSSDFLTKRLDNNATTTTTVDTPPTLTTVTTESNKPLESTDA